MSCGAMSQEHPKMHVSPEKCIAKCLTWPLLACRAVDRGVAKYELTHSVRSHIGADDDAFNAIRQREDEEGIRGILLQVRAHARM